MRHADRDADDLLLFGALEQPRHGGLRQIQLPRDLGLPYAAPVIEMGHLGDQPKFVVACQLPTSAAMGSDEPLAMSARNCHHPYSRLWVRPQMIPHIVPPVMMTTLLYSFRW